MGCGAGCINRWDKRNYRLLHVFVAVFFYVSIFHYISYPLRILFFSLCFFFFFFFGFLREKKKKQLKCCVFEIRGMLIECNPLFCPCGEQCSNMRLQKRQYASLETFTAGNKGYGVRAKKFITRGSLAIEYVGEVITTEMCIERYAFNYFSILFPWIGMSRICVRYLRIHSFRSF